MSGHGHGHGHGHVDLEAELNGELPEPFCEGNWRQSVVLLAGISTIVLAMTLWTHYGAAPDIGVATASPVPGSSPPAGAVGVPLSVAPETAPVVAVAGAVPFPGVAPVGPSSVHLVATTQRSAFNIAAQTIRPSVVGIRATFSRPDGTPTKIRVGSGVLVDSAGYVGPCYRGCAVATRVSVGAV
jgi:hypothetical protein